MSAPRRKTTDHEGLLNELRAACQRAGGQKSWADSVGVSDQYVSDVLHGRREPGESIYRALGYRREALYVRDDAWTKPKPDAWKRNRRYDS